MIYRSGHTFQGSPSCFCFQQINRFFQGIVPSGGEFLVFIAMLVGCYSRNTDLTASYGYIATRPQNTEKFLTPTFRQFCSICHAISLPPKSLPGQITLCLFVGRMWYMPCAQSLVPVTHPSGKPQPGRYCLVVGIRWQFTQAEL